MDATGDDVRTVDPITVPSVAVIVVDPELTEDASPVSLTVATAGFDEVQVANFVTFTCELSEYIPKAESCRVVPGAISGPDGAMEMETSEADVELLTSFTLQAGRRNRIIAIPAAVSIPDVFFIAPFPIAQSINRLLRLI